jgi:hypothetical protein
MRFLQKRSNSRFSGEVISNISKRIEGVRIKHWVEENSIKMYDKQGCVLRIETTINNRRYRALRPIASDEARLFQSVLHGQFLLHGFRNEHIRTLLFPSHKTEEEKHRNVARTS